MTSRHFTERTARTERSEKTDFSPSPRRSAPTVRRGLKKRGALPSFGDMILPIVGIFAVVLLVIFGRQFFINGMNSSPGIASTRAYAEAPAILAELERSRLEPEPVAEKTASVPEDLAEAAKNEDDEEEDLFALSVATQTQKPLPPVGQKKVNSTSNAPAKKTQPQAQTRKTQPANSNSKKTGASSVSDKQWRVQVGAYTTRAGAQEAANKIKKSGYNATVYSNPASKHFKVWVQGGADKKAADNVVKAMQKLGFNGSFSFPPAK